MQDGHKVRVRLAVRQPLPRQLKHLRCTFGVNVDLWAGARQGHPQQHCLLPQLQTPRVTPTPTGTDKPLPCEGQTAGQPEEKRAKAGSRTDVAEEQGNRKDFQPPCFIQKTTLYPRAHKFLKLTVTPSVCISSIRTHQLKSFGKLQFIFISKHFKEI